MRSALISPENIVITGASSGLGRALAVHYAMPGVALWLVGRNRERLEEACAQCRERGAAVHAVALDVTDRAAMDAWAAELLRENTVDLLIANAGVSGGSGGEAVLGESPDQLRRILSINIDGVVNTVTPFIAPMLARGRGQIAVMSSLAGFRGLPSAPAYSMSKNAVRAYGEALRGWLGRHGIAVSTVCPGYIRTPMTAKNPFPMPGLMDAPDAAAIIARGLARNRSRIAFPRRLYWPVLLLSHFLPLWISDRIFAALPAKPAVEE